MLWLRHRGRGVAARAAGCKGRGQLGAPRHRPGQAHGPPVGLHRGAGLDGVRRGGRGAHPGGLVQAQRTHRPHGLPGRGDAQEGPLRGVCRGGCRPGRSGRRFGRQGRVGQPHPQGHRHVPAVGAEEVVPRRGHQVHRPHLHDPRHPNHVGRPHLLQDPGAQRSACSVWRLHRPHCRPRQHPLLLPAHPGHHPGAAPRRPAWEGMEPPACDHRAAQL
mmetsp:Transcript_25996/g.77059  ORF Transcript_25996/g.77059 Transcript_25996/m.77059 type:complete len:217 (+) Transcript_25996:1183-1833(+)